MPTPFPFPDTDPTPIFEAYRGSYSTELLTAAVAHFDVFGRLSRTGPRSPDDLARDLGLSPRPAVVLLVALRAMGLLAPDAGGRPDLTPLARRPPVPGGRFHSSG